MFCELCQKVIILLMAISLLSAILPVQFQTVALAETLPTDVKQKLDAYNIAFTTKGSASTDSMPIGNGNIAANVWVEDNGDLVFYIAKGDSWSEATRLLKIGRVRVNISPNPFATGKAFKQELKLSEGAIYVTAGDVGSVVTIKVWIDANNPVIHVQATGESDFSIKSTTEIWRSTALPMNSNNTRSFIGVSTGTAATPTESADVVLDRADKLLWYHRNDTSLYNEMLAFQGLNGYDARYPDPYKNITFGAEIIGTNMTKTGTDNKTLASTLPAKSFDISVYAHTAQTSTIAEWEQQLNDKITQTTATPIETAFANHVKWWEDYWNRCWIFITGDADATTVTRGYLLQRYMVACQGRSKDPMKFNGGLFTMPTATQGDDYRDWGSMYWHQNTRLVYWPLLESGDFDLLMPYFDMYKKQLPIRKEIAKQFFGVDGAYYPEQIFAYGADGTRVKMQNAINGVAEYTTYHWQNGFEVVNMMLDYYEMTKDEKFAQDYILPIGQEVVRFYYQKYMQTTGKLNISPSNALETYWNCTNPTDQVAGLRFIIPRMINLPSNLTDTTLLTELQGCFNALPEIPMNATATAVKPAQVYGGTKNVENPELYTVFPYRIYGVGKPNLEVGINTFNARIYKNNGCWYQDGVQAAYLGLTNSAKTNVVYGFSAKAPTAKFSGFWAKGNDEVPDYDNGGQASIALQKMLMQFEGKDIRLLPAWPKNWNVDFKLYAPDNTIMRVVYENSAIVSTQTNKPERLNDIIETVTFQTPPTTYTTTFTDTASTQNAAAWSVAPTVVAEGSNNVYSIATASQSTKISAVGDKSLKNYKYSAKIKPTSLLTNFGGGIIARYTDDKNFVMFRFSGTTAADKGYEVYKFENGTGTIIAPKVLFNFDTTKYYKLTAEVFGSKLNAYIDDQQVFSNINIGTVNAKGSVGLRVYSGTVLADDFTVETLNNTIVFGATQLNGSILTTSLVNGTSNVIGDVSCIVAVYDSENVLHSVANKNITLDNSTNSEVAINMTLDLPSPLTGYKIRIYAWDNFNNLKVYSRFIEQKF